MSHALTGACELLCQCSLSIYRTFQCNISELNSFGWSRFIWEIPGYLMCAIHILLQIYCHQLPDQLRCAFNSLCCDCSTESCSVQQEEQRSPPQQGCSKVRNMVRCVGSLARSSWMDPSVNCAIPRNLSSWWSYLSSDTKVCQVSICG